MRRLLRHPALHFVVLGGVLFAALRVFGWGLSGGNHPPERAEVVVTSAQIAALALDFKRAAGREATRAELDALVRDAVDDELLYREARHLELDRGDKSVRARLVDKMRAVGDGPKLDEEQLYRAALALGFDDDLVIRRMLRDKMRLLLRADPARVPPSDEELRAYLEGHTSEYETKEATSFDHVFLSDRARGGHIEKDADALLAQFRSEAITPEAAPRFSDPFPLGLSVRARPASAIVFQFGAPFAEAVTTLAPGSWAGPIRSPFGVHLVWVRAHDPGGLPPLDAVRQRVTTAVLEERAASHLREALARLRDLYRVRIEGGEARMADSRSANGGAP